MGLYRETTPVGDGARSPETPVGTRESPPLPDVSGKHFDGRAPSTVHGAETREMGQPDMDKGGRQDGAVILDGLREQRLKASLQTLVDEIGRVKAAEELGIDRKTLWRSMSSGRVTPRLAEALERRLLTNEGPAPSRQKEHAEALERRLDALEETVRDGLTGVRESVAALGASQDQALRRLEGLLSQTAVVRAAKGSPGTPATGRNPETEAVIGRSAGVPPKRPYPQLVTAEPEPGEELLYGEAMPAIAEWRRVRRKHESSTHDVDRLDAAVRLRELEVTLIGDHELTLPPAAYPWNRADRRDEVWRRREWLVDLRVDRRRAVVRRWVRRLLTLGMWQR